MAKIILKHVSKMYSTGLHEVNDLSMEIADKDFVFFVGPKRSGKTALIRLIAGLDNVTSGDIYMDGVLVNDLGPKERKVAMVFKNHTLYPDKTIYENLAFGLKLQKMKCTEIDQKVRTMARNYGFEKALDLLPSELNAKQCHQIVLARAIIREPKILLLDEPFSDLGQELRFDIRHEAEAMYQSRKMTVICMTSNYEDAMKYEDAKIVILKEGKIQQIGTPKEILAAPANEFVKEYITIQNSDKCKE